MSDWVSQSGPCPAFIEGTYSGGWSLSRSTGSIKAWGDPGQLSPGWNQSKTNPDVYKSTDFKGSLPSLEPSISATSLPSPEQLQLTDLVLQRVLRLHPLSDAHKERLCRERYGLDDNALGRIGFLPGGWQHRRWIAQDIKETFALND